MRIRDFLGLLAVWAVLIGLSYTGLGAWFGALWVAALVVVFGTITAVLRFSSVDPVLWGFALLYGAVVLLFVVLSVRSIMERDWYDLRARFAVVISMGLLPVMVHLSITTLGARWPY